MGIALIVAPSLEVSTDTPLFRLSESPSPFPVFPSFRVASGIARQSVPAFLTSSLMGFPLFFKDGNHYNRCP